MECWQSAMVSIKNSIQSLSCLRCLEAGFFATLVEGLFLGVFLLPEAPASVFALSSSSISSGSSSPSSGWSTTGSFSYFSFFFVVCPFSPFPYPLVWPPPQSHQMNHQISQGQEEHDRLNLIFYRHQVLKTNTWTFAIRIPLQSSVPQNEIDSVKTRPTTHYLLNLLKTSNFLPWLRCKQVSLGAPMTQKKAARLLSVARDWKQAVQAVHSRSDWD